MGQACSRRITPLFVAVLCGHLDLVKRLVQSGADPLDRDDDGGTTLRVAAVGGNVEIAKYLVAECRVDPLARDRHGTPAIVWAIQENHPEVIEYLKRWPLLGFAADEGWNALTEAVRAGNLALVRELIERHGQRVDYKTRSEMTLLHIACGSSHAEGDVVAWLLENGAPVMDKDITGKSAMHFAAMAGNIRAISLLFAAAEMTSEGKALVDGLDTDGFAPLHSATAGRRTSAVRALLAVGANPDIPDQAGFSPLAHAVNQGDWRSAKALIEEHADPGRTAGNAFNLRWAVDKGDLRMVELLLSASTEAIVSATSVHGAPLSVAARRGHTKIVAALLRAGADIRATDSSGNDAFALAVQHGNRDVVSLMRHWVSERPALADLVKRQEECKRQYAIRDLATALSRHGDVSVAGVETKARAAVGRSGTRLTVGAIHTLLAKGLDEEEATLYLNAAVMGGRLDIVDAIRDQARNLLQLRDLTAAAELAVRHGHGVIARHLVDAGAEPPWWWRRGKLSERADFLHFTMAPADYLDRVAQVFRTSPPGTFAGSPDRWAVRRASLPFLPEHQLIAIECLDSLGQNEQFMVAKSDGELVMLDWTNGPIYPLLKDLSFTQEALLSYIRFFFYFVRSAGGRFEIVSNVRQIPWKDGVDAAEQDRAAGLLRPLTIRRQKTDHALARCTLIYQNSLFHTFIRVCLAEPVTDATENTSGPKVSIGQMALERDRALVTNMTVDVDGSIGIFG